MQKKYCTLALLLASAAGLVLIVGGFRPLGKGLILGAIFSVINFVLLGLALPARIGASRRKASFIAFGSLAGRFLILAIPFVAAIKSDTFNLIATVAGVFMVQAVIMIHKVANPVLGSFYKKIRSGDISHGRTR